MGLLSDSQRSDFWVPSLLRIQDPQCSAWAQGPYFVLVGQYRARDSYLAV